MEPTLRKEDSGKFIELIRRRFEVKTHRHKGLSWNSVEEKLQAYPEKLDTLYKMEMFGGEPDVAEYDEERQEFVFIDFSEESPLGRRSLCYDDQALEARKKNRPKGSAIGLAEEIGVRLLTESEYRKYQTLEPFDKKTSSWIETPYEIRNQGGALFANWCFGLVWVYYNVSADSYYASRGFRGILRV